MGLEDQKEKKFKESIILRGICASIGAMSMPTFYNLKEMLALFGYDLIKK